MSEGPVEREPGKYFGYATLKLQMAKAEYHRHVCTILETLRLSRVVLKRLPYDNPKRFSLFRSIKGLQRALVRHRQTFQHAVRTMEGVAGDVFRHIKEDQ